MDLSYIIIMRGVSGSGKSKIAEQLPRSLNDTIFSLRNHIKGKITKESLFKAQLDLFDQFISDIRIPRMHQAIIDSPNCSFWEISPYIFYAKTFLGITPEIYNVPVETSKLVEYSKISNTPYNIIEYQLKELRQELPVDVKFHPDSDRNTWKIKGIL